MPKIYLDTISATTSLAIWHITESEGFFLEKVPLKTDITHPHKRLQHLAGRYLLQEIDASFPLDLIRIADTRKPYIQGESHRFSISHCGNFAAAIVSTTHRVGIDIEIYTERMLKILHKFLGEEEREMLNGRWTTDDGRPETADWQLATLLWSAKEAVYKWFGNGEMDFKRHMPIIDVQGRTEGKIMMDFRRNAAPVELSVDYKLLELFSLAWVVSEI